MVEKAVEEKEILQKQFEKVVSELREQSDSESIEEMDFKVELAEKRATIKQLEFRIKGAGLQWKEQCDQLQLNLDTIQSQYDFSIRANGQIREDYDLLQGKLDKTMKTANNQIMDRNEQIEKLD